MNALADEIKTGGQAFPCEQGYTPDGWNQTFEPGMTLRDWFAGRAMQGYIASVPLDGNLSTADIARFAYDMADAMLKARESA